MIYPKKISGPLLAKTRFKDVKDPCVVFDGSTWHIYGSGGDVRSEVWQIFHAISPHLGGPWEEKEPVEMNGVRGDHVAAPSVMYDEKTKQFHMIVQTEFTTIGGSVEYLVSSDGHTFNHVNTVLRSEPHTSEAGIYDPHQTIIKDRKYIVYAGTPAVLGADNRYIIQPDVHLAECNNHESTWDGEWVRKGIILDHDHIDWHHNPRDHKEYEWGIEGPQIVELPNGTFLLNATCFLAEGKFGTRQRVFFAVSDHITGPYKSFGPVIDPSNYPDKVWMSGENGHATAIVKDDELVLFFQARSQLNPEAALNDWNYGYATFDLKELVAEKAEEIKELKKKEGESKLVK